MDFLQHLKEFLLENGGIDTNPSEIRWSPNGSGVMYLEMNCSENGRAILRCKFKRGIPSPELVSVQPMHRLTESGFPIDSTIKSVYSLFGSIAGVGGVANRNVNR
jgi:hypothetical protein